MDWLKESETFNQMVDYYDKYRPSYPQEIIDTIIKKANLHTGSKILEIGSGSGKATTQFADYGFEMCCIDPGVKLIEKGRERFQGKNIKFIASRFEDFTTTSCYYDAIISAQAFHWLPQPTGYEKCASALKDCGYLAPFWNIEILQETTMDKELMELMEKHNAFTSVESETAYNERMEKISNGLADSGFFSAPEVIHSRWEKDYTLDEYFGLALTGNVFVQNSAEVKQAYYSSLRELAAKHNGVFKRHYVCELYLARKITRSKG